MFLFRKALAVTAAAVLVMAVSCGVSDAAKAKVRVKAIDPMSTGRTKITVPAYILKGSTVAQGRAFYRSSVPENFLAGIWLGRPANAILAKWGNPSRITLGTSQAEVAVGGPPPPGGPAYAPPGALAGANPYAAAARMLGMQTSPGGGDLPRLPGYDMPGAAPQQPGQPQADNGARKLSLEEVTWTYDIPNGITLEFIITDGTITQITVGGQGPWGLSKTRTGIQLGDSYKLVLWVCGYPTEAQKYVGRFLRVSYIEKNRVLFTFLNKKLVGITAAMVQDELSGG